MTHPIIDVQVTQRAMPLVVPFAVAYGTTVQAELTLVEFRDHLGQSGLGEGAPASYMTPEGKRAAFEQTAQLARGFVGMSPQAALKNLAEQHPKLIADAPLVYCAVELGLMTLAAAQSGQSGPRSLFPQWSGPAKTVCATDITVPLMPVHEIASFWQRYTAHEFEIVKVKVSGDITQDLLRLAELERVLPAPVKIFLDGNQGFTVASAQSLLASIEQKGWRQPLFFEQPLPKHAWAELASLSRSVAIPICLDETVATVADVERVARDKTATMINLKLMKSGVLESERMLKVAVNHGLTVMIGGMVECEITMGASLDLYCSSGAIEYADLDTPFFFLESLTTENPWSRNSSRLQARQGFPRLLDTGKR